MNKYNTYNYKVYGLKIKSEIKIDEFVEVDNFKGEIDVNYVYGKMPKKIYELKNNGITNLYNKDEVWFHVKDIASYYICNGNKVIVEPCDNSDKLILNVFLMCSCLGFIMLQRDKVAIHGGVISFKDKDIIITGDRGAGKSTLTTALRLKGYYFMADDVSAITINSIPMINHGFPYQKLCKDAMEKFNISYENITSFISDSQIKYIVPAHDKFINKDTPLYAIVEIKQGEVNNVEVNEIRGSSKLNVVIKNIYRGEFMPYWGGITPEYFKKCLNISKNIKCYEMIRPKGKFTVDDQIRMLESIVV